MFNLINVNNKCHGKDCADWVPLKDGTATGDSKYCDLSQYCRQLGMKTDWYQFFNYQTREYDFDYFCTGMRVNDTNKSDDDEVS